MKKNKVEHYSDKEALEFHNSNKSGKIEIISSKPMTSKRDLALAYSPGVAAPVKAIAENPDTASLLGIEVQKIVPLVFLFSGLLCGIAGVLFVVNYTEVGPFMGDQVGTKAIAAMVLGGLGSIWGAIAGGLFVGLLEALSIHFFGADTVDIAVWGVLLIFIIIKPRGLFGGSKVGKGKL